VQLFGVGITAADADEVEAALLAAADRGQPLTMTALAVHGLMECQRDPQLRKDVNSIDIVTADGQPVRWALRLLCGVRLRDKVPGPSVVSGVCAGAAARGLSVFLLGSTAATLERLADGLRAAHPGLVIAAVQPDRFREATPEEDAADRARIRQSGASVVLVGRGCPRQERWVAHHAELPSVLMAVGAAFDYHAGNLRRAPQLMQRWGLEWLHRLVQEPRRLFPRYMTTNSRFVVLLTRELIHRMIAGDRGPRRCRAPLPNAAIGRASMRK
jgi:exopolysaccharide biosynthesis WecB/TagA/CpsF family protein